MWAFPKRCLRVIISLAKEFLGIYFDTKSPYRFENGKNTQFFEHRILLKCSSNSLPVCVRGGAGTLRPAFLPSPQVMPVSPEGLGAPFSDDDVGTKGGGRTVLALEWKEGATVPLGSGLLVSTWARLPGRRLAGSPQSGKSPTGPRIQPHLSQWPFGPAARTEFSGRLASQPFPLSGSSCSLSVSSLLVVACCPARGSSLRPWSQWHRRATCRFFLLKSWGLPAYLSLV